jgi:hypothetical protein
LQKLQENIDFLSKERGKRVSYNIEVFSNNSKIKIAVEYNGDDTIKFYRISHDIKMFITSFSRCFIETDDKGIGLSLDYSIPELYLDSDTMDFIFYWLGYLEKKLK